MIYKPTYRELAVRTGANTQGATIDEARDNLKEAVMLVLEANRELSQEAIRGADVIREDFILPAA